MAGWGGGRGRGRGDRDATWYMLFVHNMLNIILLSHNIIMMLSTFDHAPHSEAFKHL